MALSGLRPIELAGVGDFETERLAGGGATDALVN